MKKKYLACALSLPLLAAAFATDATAADSSLIYARGDDSYLYTINPVDVGNATRIGRMTVVSGNNIGWWPDIHGMSFEPATGTLYATYPYVIWSADTRTGALTQVAYDGNWNYSITDSDFSSDGTLYGSDKYRLHTQGLFTANQSALPNPFGPTGGGNGLAFGPGDLLYSSYGENLGIVDPATGIRTLAQTYSYSGFPEGFPSGLTRFNALSYDDLNSVLYGSLNDSSGKSGPSGTTYLATINVASGLVTNLGVPRYNGTDIFMMGLAIDILVDSDGDNIPDRWEQSYFGDQYPETYLTVMNQTTDYDEDGLKDADEYANRTDPTDPDSDDDGLTDYAEVNTHHTDPTKADTDGDLVSDGDEVAAGKNPLDPADGILRQVNSGSDGYWPDQADVAVDSEGNVHVVWNAETVDWDELSRTGDWEVAWRESCFDYDGGEGARELYYKMFGPDGTTLINDTMISENNCMESMRPTLAIDSSDKVYVTWQERTQECWDCGVWPPNVQIFVAGLNPALDNRNGDAAAPATIKILADKWVSDGEEWPNNSPRIAIDPSDDLHLVWERNGSGGGPATIKYAKLAGDGEELIPATDLRSGDHNRSVPDLAIDSAGRVHVAWNESYGWDDDWDFERCYNEIHYALLDGSDDFTFLVPPTMMTEDDCDKSNRQSISVDTSGKAYIVWQDNGDSSDKNISFMKIDPAQYDAEAGTDEEGETINRQNMKLSGEFDGEDFIDDTVIYTPDYDGESYVSIKVPFSRIGPDGNIQVTWHETVDGAEGLMSMAVDQNGVEVEGSRRQTSNNTYTWTDWTNGHIAFGCQEPYIVWTDYADGDNGSKISLYHEPDTDDDGDGIPNCFDTGIGNPDTDNDGDIDGDDLDRIMANFNDASASECPRCDLDGDGDIDILDARLLIAENPELSRDRRQRRQTRTRSRRSRR